MKWTTLIFASLVSGIICALMAQRKNLSVTAYFWCGALLGVIGIVITMVTKPLLPEAPPGMFAAKCTRCNAVQNIPIQDRQFECWQCHTVETFIPWRRSAEHGVDDFGVALTTRSVQVTVGVDGGGDGFVAELGLDRRQRPAGLDQP
jgi:hypothetical protein